MLIFKKLITRKLFLIFLIYLYHHLPLKAQKPNYEAIEDFYSNPIADCNGVRFIRPEDNLVDAFQKLKQIIIFRHGEPNVKIHGWVKKDEAREYLDDYKSSKVYAIDSIPICLKAGEINNVYTSTLNRAKNTADLIMHDSINIVADSTFSEFDNRVSGLPNVKLPSGLVLGSSRLFWLLGFNDGGIESFKEAKERAKEGAQKLQKLALSNQRVVLVAHGFMNRYLAKYLKDLDWKQVKDGGSDYLANSVFVKITDDQ